MKEFTPRKGLRAGEKEVAEFTRKVKGILDTQTNLDGPVFEDTIYTVQAGFSGLTPNAQAFLSVETRLEEVTEIRRYKGLGTGRIARILYNYELYRADDELKATLPPPPSEYNKELLMGIHNLSVTEHSDLMDFLDRTIPTDED